MTEEKVFYFYSKDTSVDEHGKRNPLPRKLRQRRQVIAGVIQDNHIYFGKAECSPLDVFVTSVGRDKARGRALQAIAGSIPPIMKLEITDAKQPGKLFVEAAKTLITPGPAVKTEQAVRYKKLRNT